MVRKGKILEIGDKVRLKGNTANAMQFKEGIVRRTGRTNSGQKIYYVSRFNSKFTTPFMRSNIY